MPENQLGSYRIIRQIGRGGQATVYLAEDVRLHRQVALKVLDPGFSPDRTVFERFRREAEITSRLDHPGICTIFETGDEAGVLWIAMRYIEGDSLAKKISTAKEDLKSGSTSTYVTFEPQEEGRVEEPKRTPPPGDSSGPKTWIEIARLLGVFENAARALHVAHEAGVIHRDIKPGNVIITKDGDPVIVDFGLAQDLGADQSTLTTTGGIVGTPAYMSPEQIVAQRIRLDRRTDIYSLGVSLYECLTLQRPFDAPTRDGLYQAILTKEPSDPRTINPAIPSDLKVVIATALEKDRDRRYQTALDFADELQRVRTHQPIVAKVGSPGTELEFAL